VTTQAIYSGRQGRVFLVLAAMALLTMVAVATAGAKAPIRHPRSALHCKEGSESFSKSVRSDGKSKVVRGCRRQAVKPKSTTVPPAPTTAPPTTVTPPETTTPPGTEPVVTSGPTEVHAAIGTGFVQNPLVPDEVTWSFSASATQTVTTDGVSQTETVPLPAGELAFFVDGKLECEIHAIGAIDGSACTSLVKGLGAHEIEAIFTNGELSSTAVRTDYLDKYPTQTNLQVSIEPTLPEYIEVGEAPDGIQPEYGYEVGRLRITGSVDPGSYPTFSCEGEPVGCLIPDAAGLKAHNGSVTVPLYAKHVYNFATELGEWEVAFDAYEPSLRKEGRLWKFPEESVGAYFFHAVAEPNLSLYEPSSVTVPLNLNGGHYPFIREWWNGVPLGSPVPPPAPPVEAVEGTPTKVLTFGTYEKFSGIEGSLSIKADFSGPVAETEGCEYFVTANGETDNEVRRANSGRVEIYGGFSGKTALPAGPYTLALWVERQSGKGPGKCTLKLGQIEAYEKL
jgi:hypothetical protein